MMVLRFLVLLLAMFGAAVTESRGDDAPERQLSLEADVFVAHAGPVAVDVIDDILHACRPGLPDLRFFDLQGNEAAYVVDPGGPLDVDTEATQVVAAELVAVSRREIHREDGPPLRRETYDLAVPPEAPVDGSWELSIDSRRDRFVRSVWVLALPSDEAARPLVDRESIFRLADARTKTSVSLPATETQRLRVILEGEDEFFLEPQFSFRKQRLQPIRPPIVVELQQRSERYSGGRMIVTAERPTGLVPARVRVETATPWFDREVEVWDERSGFPDRQLGHFTVKRGQGADEPRLREIALSPARGERLRFEISGGDSPPLRNLQLMAIAPRPRVIFVASTVAEDGRAGVLRFRSRILPAPTYDIAGLAPHLDEAQTLAPGRLGPIRRNAAYAAVPALQFALRPGSVVDGRLYSHSRALTVESADAGLSRFRLDAEDLALLRLDLADIRVIDQEGRQWPYLVDHATAWAEARLQLTDSAVERGVSRYTLTPPVTSLTTGRVIIDTQAPFIDRPYRLLAAVHDGEEVVVATGTLTRDHRSLTPLEIRFPPQRIDAVELVVDNGDDSPLDIEGGYATVTLPDVFLVAPDGKYEVLLGYPEAEAPHYEVSEARETVLAVPAAEAMKGGLQPNPQFSQRARFVEGEGVRTLPQLFLWAALVVAVVVLGIVTARIVRNEAPAA